MSDSSFQESSTERNKKEQKKDILKDIKEYK